MRTYVLVEGHETEAVLLRSDRRRPLLAGGVGGIGDVDAFLKHLGEL